MTGFLRKAVAEAMPGIVAEIEARLGLDRSCFRLEQTRKLGPNEIAVPIRLGKTTVEECLTCDRRERLFESVDACREASPGACRFALRRVE